MADIFEKTLIELYQTLQLNSMIFESSIEKIMFKNINNTKYLSEILCNNNGYISVDDMKCNFEFCYFGKYGQDSRYYFWKICFAKV